TWHRMVFESLAEAPESVFLPDPDLQADILRFSVTPPNATAQAAASSGASAAEPEITLDWLVPLPAAPEPALPLAPSRIEDAPTQPVKSPILDATPSDADALLRGTLDGLPKMSLPPRVPVLGVNADLTQYARHLKLPLLSRPGARFLRDVHNQAHVNLVTSNPMLESARGLGIQRVRLWPKAVDTDLFRPERATRAMRERLTAGHPDDPLIVCVSRLSFEKRIDWLYAPVTQIPGVRLALIGSGPAEAELRQRFAGTNTVFTGYMTGTELAAALSTADHALILEVFAPGETRQPGEGGQALAAAVDLPPDRKRFLAWEDVAAEVVARARPGDLVVTMGAPPISLLGDELLAALGGGR
ncbi:MAG: hypothetical protein FWJ87_16260, partial [Micromonosporaceae bacterium]